MFAVVLSSILTAHKRSASWLAVEVGRSPAAVSRWLVTTSPTLPDPKLLPAIRAALSGTGVPASDIAALDRAYLGHDDLEVADG